jgi:hypothetical protein
MWMPIPTFVNGLLITGLYAMHHDEEQRKGIMEFRTDEAEISQSGPGIFSLEVDFMQCVRLS